MQLGDCASAPRWFLWAPPMTPHPPSEEREGPGHSWRGATFIKDLRPAQDPSPYSPPPRLCSADLGPGTGWHSVVAIILLLFFAVGVMTNVHRDTSVSEWPLGVESCPTTPLTDARKLGTARSPRAQSWASSTNAGGGGCLRPAGPAGFRRARRMMWPPGNEGLRAGANPCSIPHPEGR